MARFSATAEVAVLHVVLVGLVAQEKCSRDHD